MESSAPPPSIPKGIALPTWMSLYVECLRNGEAGHSGTAFVVSHGDEPYLITNWHVVTGRESNTGQPSSTATDPDTICVWLHDADALGEKWIKKAFPLRRPDSREPMWLEHPDGQHVDVVALPLTGLNQFKGHAGICYIAYASLWEFDMIVLPSEPVSIIGFPYGQSSVGKLPLWKTGHVASDITIDCEDKPIFYIDATTKEGMSGSPVIARRIGGYHSSKGWILGAQADRFLGVYSAQFKSGIGVVWKPTVISEIFAAANGIEDRRSD